MAQENTEAKLKKLLKQDKVQLWSPPYTGEDGGQGPGPLQELAERYAPLLCLSVLEVSRCLEVIRVQTVNRSKENRVFRETSVATLELLLPRDVKKDPKTKSFLDTRLDTQTQDLVDRIKDEFNLKHIKLILNGKTLNPGLSLVQQNVRNHSKIMVLRVSDSEWTQQDEDKLKNQNQSVHRTQKGFQILSERDGSEDPEATPFLEITDQKGNPLKIPPQEKKALMVAMGFHEKGRSLMKRKQYDEALSHLLQADQHFSGCDSALLLSVDNFAVLQLDIVWCYRSLEALSCLEDGKLRLQRAERGFLQCYGEQQQRLLRIKGNTGREEVLFLRLHLLQSLLLYIEGNDAEARQQLSTVETLYGRLRLDSEKMAELMSLGFSEREARLGLRACHGDLQEAAAHITNRRQEREELKQREHGRRQRRTESISVLTELGFTRRDAARALHQTDGDVDRAYEILLDGSQAAQPTNHNREGVASPEKVEQLIYLGFERTVSETALKLTGGDLQSATQLLLDNQGVLSPDVLSTSPPSSLSSPSTEEPSTSSTSTEDSELVNEVLGDISRHEEDYLDVTLEEESELIDTMKTYLTRGHVQTM